MSGPKNGPRDLPPVSTPDPRAGQPVIADWLEENYGEHTQQAYGAFMAAAADLLDDLGRFGFQVVKR